MSKHIIKDRQIIDNHWLRLDDDSELPANGDIIVSCQRWQQQREQLLARDGKLGVCIGDKVSVDDIKDQLNDFALIAIEFPAFKDGRGYSYARLLRERYGFDGEIRAVGNVLRDQLYYMSRCGFDAFEMAEGRSIEDALNAFADFSVNYQPAFNSPATTAA